MKLTGVTVLKQFSFERIPLLKEGLDDSTSKTVAQVMPKVPPAVLLTCVLVAVSNKSNRG